MRAAIFITLLQSVIIWTSVRIPDAGNCGDLFSG